MTNRAPSGHVVGTLPRTGTDHTQALAAAGAALLLAGFALEATSRRSSARAGGQPST
jgi:LPXTG-motif cell wall-anchored protein